MGRGTLGSGGCALSRDLRDPEALGKAYRALRARGVSIAKAVVFPADRYSDGGRLSNDPAEHHSQTPQTISLNDGAEG